jgi:nitrilase
MRVAVCQMNAGGGDVLENVATAARLLDDAGAAGADLAALPELWPLYDTHAAMREIAAPIPGPLTDPVAEVARERSMWVVGGSVPEAADDHVFNTSCLFDPTGEVVARYRKIHLFDVELPDQPPLRESALFSPGDELVTRDTDLGRLGLSICYDLRFPELYRGLMTLGAEIVFAPSAFTEVTGRAHWEVLVRARAIEEQCFVVAPAQWGPWGPPADGRRTHGTSMVVDPWGELLVRAPGEGDGVWTAEIDMRRLHEVRDALPALRHRRLGPVC